MRHDVFIAGFGGQGVLLAGNLLSHAAIHEGLNVSCLPAYGVEKRGGAAMCTVVFSDGDTGSPVVGFPSVALLLNQLSFDKYVARIKPGGICVINSDLVTAQAASVTGLRLVSVPMNRLAIELGDIRMVNMVACGVYAAVSGALAPASLEAALKKTLPERRHGLVAANTRAIRAGYGVVDK